METKSKVKRVTGNGTWNKDGKTYFKWEVEMENGDIGGVMTAKEQQDKWVVGKETTYTKAVNGQYTNFKIVEEKPQGKFQSKDEGVITWLSCFSSVCNMVAEKQGSNTVKIEEAINWANMAFDAAMKKSTK